MDDAFPVGASPIVDLLSDAADTLLTTDTGAAAAASAGTTKAPVIPATTEVMVKIAAKPTSTPSGSLRERRAKPLQCAPGERTTRCYRYQTGVHRLVLPPVME